MKNCQNLDSEGNHIKKSACNNAAGVKKLSLNNGDSYQAPTDINKDLKDEKGGKRSISEKETFDNPSSQDYYDFKLCGKKKLSLNKSLLTFRIAQFLWYGAGNLSTIFLSIFVKQRGLTLVELSSAYSMIFVFQLLSCSITGIITDKIGNAKPILMCLMILTSFVFVSMLITPNVNSNFCIQEKKNLNTSGLTQVPKNFSFCYENCLLSNKKYAPLVENYSQNFVFENVSSVELHAVDSLNKSRSRCHSFYLPSTNYSLHFPSDDCCNECANTAEVNCTPERDVRLVVAYAVLILAFYSVVTAAYRFTDFTSVSLAGENDSDYGKEIAFAQCGSATVTIIVAIVLNTDRSSGSNINYDPIIGIAVGIIFCACLALSMTKVPILPPGINLLKSFFTLARDINILAFLLLVFVAGNGFAFTFTFRLLFLETLNAPSTLVALHSVTITLYAFPLLLTSKWWLKKFGTNKLFVLCLLLYTVNCAAYSYISNPWWSLLIDVSVSFTYYLFWVAVVTHCWSAAPVGFVATLNGVTGSVHFGMGRSSGVFFGGMLMNYVGTRQTYRIMSAVCFVTAILYSIFIYKKLRSSPATDDNANANGNKDSNALKDVVIRDKEKKGSEQIKVHEQVP